jgi:O-antigen ligase
LTVAIGTTAFGIAFQNGYISYRAFVYAAVLAATANLIADFVGFDSYVVYTGTDAPDRSSGLTGNANSLALLLVFTSILVWMEGGLFAAAAKMLTVPFIIAAVQTTGSRKGLILAGLAAMFLAERFWRGALTNWGRLRIVGAVALVVLTGFVLVSSRGHLLSESLAMERMQRGLSGTEASFEGRVGYVQTGLELFAESPIVGHGMGQFASLSGFGIYSHNNYIELLVSGGLLAICIFYSMHFLIIRNIVRSKERWTHVFMLLCLLVTDVGCVTYNNKMLSVLLVVLFLLTDEAKRARAAGENSEKGAHAAPPVRVR